MVDLLIENASQILTLARPGLEPPFAGRDAGELGIVEGAVAIDGGRIVAVGPDAVGTKADKVVDARKGVVLPGFVDCHTHAVFYGGRADEFEERARGVSYQEIARRGGGIRATVSKLRAASDEQLASAVKRHYDRFLRLGTTTIEAKSGYGLSTEHELRSLRALGIEHRIDVVRTCLAAHTFPEEFRKNPKGYVDLVCEEIYPAVVREGLAKYCDVFVERGAFSFEYGEKVLEAGKALGLRGRVHADQLSRNGGARLACRVGAITADHLEFCTKEDAVAMRNAGVIAVLLPAANHTLDQNERPPARAMIAHSCPVAVATDFNPGSAPTQSMPLMLNFACVRFGLSVAEAIVGATINGACATGVEDRVGSLEIGKQADVLVCAVREYPELAYWFGHNPVRHVVKNGELVR